MGTFGPGRPPPRRQELETRLAALGGAMPAVDTVEVDLESSQGAPAPAGKRVSVTLRANHRRVVRVTEEGPTLTAALELAMSDAVRKGDAPGTRADTRTRAAQ